jgi:hypothetical protein
MASEIERQKDFILMGKGLGLEGSLKVWEIG